MRVVATWILIGAIYALDHSQFIVRPPAAASPSVSLIFSTTFPSSSTVEADGKTRLCTARNQCTGTCPTGFWPDAAAICGSNGGVKPHGSQGTTGHPNGGAIASAANFTGGGGGNGYRHYVADGHDVNDGGIKVDLSFLNGGSSPDHVYIRFYLRYMLGFAWTTIGYSKDLYFTSTSGSEDWTTGFAQGQKFWIWNGGGCGTQTICSADGVGWDTVMGGATSDGLFHCRQIEFDSRGGSGAAIVKMWELGVLKVSTTTAPIPAATFPFFIIGSNYDVPANGAGDGYIDFDDFAVSTVSMPSCAYGNSGS